MKLGLMIFFSFSTSWAIQSHYAIKNSLINWQQLNLDSWLDVGAWKKERLLKDANPQWRQEYRQNRSFERIGKVIECVGECSLELYKRSKPLKAGSILYEGDEVVTGKHSGAWLVMANGDIIRMSPESSIAVNEFNLAQRNSLALRLNYGHIHLQTRQAGSFTPINLEATDAVFLPLSYFSVNRQLYRILEYQLLGTSEKFQAEASQNLGAQLQYRTLNKQRNKEIAKSLTRISSPVGQLKLSSGLIDFAYVPGRVAALEYAPHPFNFKSSNGVSTTAHFQMASETTFKKLLPRTLYKVTEAKLEVLTSESGYFNFSKIQTKRIPEVHLAQELILQKDFAYLYEKKINSSQDSRKKYALRLWSDEEIKAREDFLDKALSSTEAQTLQKLSIIYPTTNKLPDNKIYARFGVAAGLKLSKKKRSEVTMEQLKFSLRDYKEWLVLNGKN